MIEYTHIYQNKENLSSIPRRCRATGIVSGPLSQVILEASTYLVPKNWLTYYDNHHVIRYVQTKNLKQIPGVQHAH